MTVYMSAAFHAEKAVKRMLRFSVRPRLALSPVAVYPPHARSAFRVSFHAAARVLAPVVSVSKHNRTKSSVRHRFLGGEADSENVIVGVYRFCAVTVVTNRVVRPPTHHPVETCTAPLGSTAARKGRLSRTPQGVATLPRNARLAVLSGGAEGSRTPVRNVF